MMVDSQSAIHSFACFSLITLVRRFGWCVARQCHATHTKSTQGRVHVHGYMKTQRQRNDTHFCPHAQCEAIELHDNGAVENIVNHKAYCSTFKYCVRPPTRHDSTTPVLSSSRKWTLPSLPMCVYNSLWPRWQQWQQLKACCCRRRKRQPSNVRRCINCMPEATPITVRTLMKL
jgi:hypothetical protein